MKLSLMISRNWGSTLYREDAENSAEYACALDGNFVKAMNSTIKVRGVRHSNLSPYLYFRVHYITLHITVEVLSIVI